MSPRPPEGPRGGPRPVSLDDLTVERVLRTVEAISPGRVAAYGQIGAIVGIGARQVGRIMGEWGSSAPWWRVTSASGALPAELLATAREHWDDEATPQRADGRGVRVREATADLAALRHAAHQAWVDVPEG